jgi:hypothetical protein
MMRKRLKRRPTRTEIGDLPLRRRDNGVIEPPIYKTVRTGNAGDCSPPTHFVKGTQGRRKGSINYITAIMKDAVLRGAAESDRARAKEPSGGLIAYLKSVADEFPTAYMRLLARLIPHDLRLQMRAELSTVHRAHPPQFAYKRGYLTDMNTGYIADARGPRSPIKSGVGNIAPSEAKDLPRGDPWPTQHSGTYPTWQNTVGGACTCENGRPGTLQRAPDNSSVLICVESRQDAASVYYAMKDAAQYEYKRYGPRSNISCCSGCTERNGRDADIVAPMGTYPVGGSWPEGCTCDLGNGEYGVLVKEGDVLVCRARQVGNGDATPITPDSAQAVRDRAYQQMVEESRNAWRNPW